MVRELSALDPLRSTVAIATEWAGIILAVVLYQRFLHPIFLPILVIWIGARQHALAILMHDGAHYLLFKNRRLNAVVSELFLAWPLFITMRAYRGSHFAHHRHVNTENDPDLMRKQNSEWEFPKSWGALGGLLARDVFGLNTHQQLFELADMSDQKEVRSREGDLYAAARILYYVIALSLVTYFQLWPIFVLLWVVPILTWLKMIMRIRSIAEHFAIENDHAYTKSRTTLPSFLERLLVAPRNVNFHLEHHLYPSVPFFRLPKLHAVLMKDTVFQCKAHVTSTYWGVLQECVRRSN
jgi:fatty acid desaturase